MTLRRMLAIISRNRLYPSSLYLPPRGAPRHRPLTTTRRLNRAGTSSASALAQGAQRLGTDQMQTLGPAAIARIHVAATAKDNREYALRHLQE